MIYHGYTLTSKIKFRSVVQAIADHAFACTPYPLILSLENHCSLSQQKKMARYMKDSFGEMLLTCEDEDIVTTNLPSPEVCSVVLYSISMAGLEEFQWTLNPFTKL